MTPVTTNSGWQTPYTFPEDCYASGLPPIKKAALEALEQPQAKTMNRKKRPNPFIVDKPDHQKTQAELIEELRYMRAENDYLKELKALSEPTTAPKLKAFKS